MKNFVFLPYQSFSCCWFLSHCHSFLSKVWLCLLYIPALGRGRLVRLPFCLLLSRVSRHGSIWLGPSLCCISHNFMSISLVMCGQTGNGGLDVTSGSTEKRKNFSPDLLGIILLMQAGKKLISTTARVQCWPTFPLFNRSPQCFSARLLVGQVRLYPCHLWSLGRVKGDIVGYVGGSLVVYTQQNHSEISM